MRDVGEGLVVGSVFCLRCRMPSRKAAGYHMDAVFSAPEYGTALGNGMRFHLFSDLTTP